MLKRTFAILAINIASLAIMSLISAPAAVAEEPDAVTTSSAASAFSVFHGKYNCTISFRTSEDVMSDPFTCDWAWEETLEGAMVQDTFKMYNPEGQTIFAGITLRTYNPQQERWVNTFLDVQGAGLGMFHGNPNGDEIHLQLIGEDESGQYISKIYFTEITDQGYRWHMERSYDDGASYKLWSEIRATRG